MRDTPLCFDYRFSKQKSSRPDSLPRIFYHGFDFVCQRVKKNSFKYWRCSRYTVTGCRSRAILEHNGGLRLSVGHNHNPLTKSDMVNMYFISENETNLIVKYLLQKGPFKDFEFSLTQRGKSKLLHRGYGYVKTSWTGRNWICDKRSSNCKITCVWDQEKGLFVKGIHNHKPRNFKGIPFRTSLF